MNVHRVIVDGTKQGRRYLVTVDGEPVLLSGIPLRFMILLGLEVERGGEWISRERLWFQSENVSRYIYLLKEQVQKQLDNDWPVVENDRCGNYRLLADSVQVVRYRLFDNEYADIREELGIRA
jgi:hypothetical protein